MSHEPVSSREFEERLETSNGLAQTWEENCKRYKNDKDTLVCLESTLDNASHLANGMNNEATMDFLRSTSELEKVRDTYREKVGRPERIPTPELKTRDGKPPKPR